MQRFQNIFQAWTRPALIATAFVVSPFFLGFNIEILCLTLALLIVWFVATVWRNSAFLTLSPVALTLSAYFLWLAASLLWTPVLSISGVTFLWLFVWPLVFFGFVLDQESEQHRSRSVWFVVVGALGLAIAGIYQRFIANEIPSGPFLDRNIYAALLIACTFLLVGRLLDVPRKRFVYGMAVFSLLVFAVALTKGRAAVVTAIVGTAVFATIAWNPARKRRIAMMMLVAVIAFLLANVSWDGGLVDQVATLAHPHEAGHTRYLIWQGTWYMILDRPWLGTGLGLYPLFWPPYRHELDASGGFFAHNDFLQVWADAGLPALILFVAIFLAGSWMVWRLWRAIPRSDAKRAEFAALAAVLFALPLNSLFNYNFYVVPSLIVYGMVMARLHLMYVSLPSARQPFTFQLASGMWRGAVGLVAAVLLLYFGSIAMASRMTDQAVRLAREGNYTEADAKLAIAHRWWPSAESVLILHADLYRHLLANSNSTDANDRANVYTAAKRLIDQASELNPHRTNIYVIRAELLRANAALAGGDSTAVAADYARALELDPWHFEARYRYASLLLEQKRIHEARALLEAGAGRAASVTRDEVIPYLLFLAKVRDQTGDRVGAAAAFQRAKGLAEDRRLRLLRERNLRGAFGERLLLSAP